MKGVFKKDPFLVTCVSILRHGDDEPEMDEGVDEAIYTPTRSPMFRQRVFLCEQNFKKAKPPLAGQKNISTY